MDLNLLTATREHIFLVAASIGLAFILSLPINGLLVKVRWLIKPGQKASRTVLAVPYVAGLVLSVVLFGLGVTPAVLSLTIISIALIMQQTTTSLASPSVRLNSLAYEMVTGMKNASLYCVGNGMIVGIVGGGGYGAIILQAIRTNDLAWMIQASLLATLLALFLFGCFGLIEQLLRSRRHFQRVTQAK